jgi:hypothetical protein
MIPGIASADERWLQVALALRPAADGESGEDLGLALYLALPKAPYRVLPFIEKAYGIGTEDACEVSFEALDPEGGPLQYLAQLENALNRDITGDQRPTREKCLRGISASRNTVETHRAR